MKSRIYELFEIIALLGATYFVSTFIYQFKWVNLLILIVLIKVIFLVRIYKLRNRDLERKKEKKYRAYALKQAEINTLLSIGFSSSYIDELGDYPLLKQDIKNAQKFFASKNFGEAIKVIKKCLNKYPDIEDMYLIDLYEGLGRCHYRMNNFKKAIGSFKKALKTIQKCEGKDLFKKIVLLLNNICLSLLKLSKYKIANKYLEKALRLSIKNDFSELYAHTLSSKGLFYLAQEDLDNSRDCFLDALNIFEKLDDKENIIISLINIALTYSNSPSDLDQKFQLLNQALKKTIEIRFAPAVSNILGNLSHIFILKGKYKASIDTLQEALHIFEDNKDILNIAEVIMNISIAYYKWGKYKEAEENAIIALEFFKQENYCLGIAKIKMNLAIIYEDTNRLNLAVSSVEDSIKIFEKLKEYKYLADGSERFGRYLIDQKNYKKAKQILIKSIRMYNYLGLKNESDYAYELIGWINLFKNKINPAIKKFKTAIMLTYDQDSKSRLNNLCKMLKNLKKEDRSKIDFENILKDSKK